ncbi:MULTISPECIES: hypothetical protein [unclassified Rhodococcus (in: high G+C Gram-positive bacteria)]|uniref:hypothetical protein n=1 Tax=unclassified Rhodococcus (in: high G+C Gram-positive bacteria) TaxID=192944 RepID=UPI001FF978E6|nr:MULTISPECIES: hypothetical protein [unclassified Rhodococcus (in: high G+C Gram-positive bacteria)]
MDNRADSSSDAMGDGVPTRPYGAAEAHRNLRHQRANRVSRAWKQSLDPGQQSAVLSWASFTATFAVVRALTHWIKDGHGPSGGGMSMGGKHFHHYNIGIAMLGGVGAIAIRGAEEHRRHPVTALSYGVGAALIVDELALLLDLEDVYWAKQGRQSVDAAITIIGAGGLAIAGFAFWPEARKALR